MQRPSSACLSDSVNERTKAAARRSTWRRRFKFTGHTSGLTYAGLLQHLDVLGEGCAPFVYIIEREVLFIGHTRFSIFNPDSIAWVASNGTRFASAEEYKAYLYSEERISLRCQIFIEYSLPQLALAAADHELHHVVSYSESLPREYQKELEEAAARFPFVVLACEGSGHKTLNPHVLARQLIFESDERDSNEAFGLYRLDDDDLLSVDYFDQVQAFVRPDNVGMQVSLGRGVTVIYVDGEFYNAREAYSPMNSMGLLSICKFDEKGALVKPVDASHNRSDRSNPVILDSRKLSYLWVRHASQDTTLTFGEAEPIDIRRKVLESMRVHPRLGWGADISSLFPMLAGRVHRRESPQIAEHILLDKEVSVDDKGIEIKTAGLSGRLEILLDVECSSTIRRRNALLAFDLVDANGGSVASEEDQEILRGTGLVFSSASQIGAFQYISTDPGRHSISQTVTLPAGVYCRGIRVRRWANQESDVKLHRLVIFEDVSSAVA